MQKKKNMKPFFFDGAFGTYYNKISKANDFCEFANLNDKETVFRIHKEYINAGVSAIKTNTFGANSLLADVSTVADIIKSGYSIASDAVKYTNTVVYADIGYISSNDENISIEYIEIARTFIECGAEHFLFETLAEYDVIKPALQYIKEKVPQSEIIVSFAVSQDGYTKKGLYYKDLIAKAATNKNADIIGLNCICGPSHLYNLIKKIDLSGIRFSAMPNSGYPASLNGRTVFQDNAEYFSRKLADICRLGVEIVGGCCGTTPAHISLAIKNISSLQQAKIPALPAKVQEHGNNASNPFKEKLLSGKKVIAVELDPPVNSDCDYVISAAKKASHAGADIITIADSPLARTRADSIVVAAKIKRETGIDVLPHMSCRDKNQIALKASLLGANMESINNVLAITGDSIIQTGRNDSKGVFSFNSYNLISFISSLNTEVFEHSPFYIGAALNINAARFENELKRAEIKINSGADFFLTQAAFSDSALTNLSMAHEKLNTRILTGILPVAGYKNALFLNNEVSGIDIPEPFIESLKDKSPEESAKIALDFCLANIKRTQNFCDGYYLMTPLKKIDLVCELIKQIKSI